MNAIRSRATPDGTPPLGRRCLSPRSGTREDRPMTRCHGSPGLLGLAIVLVCYSTALPQDKPSKDPEFVDVWQVWWSRPGKMTFYSEAESKAKADEVAASLSQFPSK